MEFQRLLFCLFLLWHALELSARLNRPDFVCLSTKVPLEYLSAIDCFVPVASSEHYALEVFVCGANADEPSPTWRSHSPPALAAAAAAVPAAASFLAVVDPLGTRDESTSSCSKPHPSSTVSPSPTPTPSPPQHQILMFARFSVPDISRLPASPPDNKRFQQAHIDRTRLRPEKLGFESATANTISDSTDSVLCALHIGTQFLFLGTRFGIALSLISVLFCSICFIFEFEAPIYENTRISHAGNLYVLNEKERQFNMSGVALHKFDCAILSMCQTSKFSKLTLFESTECLIEYVFFWIREWDNRMPFDP